MLSSQEPTEVGPENRPFLRICKVSSTQAWGVNSLLSTDYKKLQVYIVSLTVTNKIIKTKVINKPVMEVELNTKEY